MKDVSNCTKPVATAVADNLLLLATQNNEVCMNPFVFFWLTWLSPYNADSLLEICIVFFNLTFRYIINIIFCFLSVSFHISHLLVRKDNFCYHAKRLKTRTAILQITSYQSARLFSFLDMYVKMPILNIANLLY